MSLNTETANRLSMCCAAPITQAYDGVICTGCNRWTASITTNDPSDLFYLASRAAKRGDSASAIEYGKEAVRLLREPSEPIEIELRLETPNAQVENIASTAR